MASLDSLLTNPTRLRQYATRDPRVAPEQQLARVGISLNAANQAASGGTGRPTGGPAPRRGSTRSSGSGLNSLMSRYDKAYDKETQQAAKAEAKAIEDATATAGEVITAIETPTGILPAQGPSGSPYLVRKPGSSTTLQDPVSGEELVPDVTSPTGLKSITAEKAKVEADKATLRSRKETAKIYEGVQKDIAKEQEAARDEVIGEKTNQYLRQGRKYYLDRVTKEPIPLQSDEEFESEQQKKMAKLAEESRAKQLKRKVANLRIDEDTIQLERKPPTDSEYSKLKEERDTTLEILTSQGLTPDEEGLSKLAGIEGGAEIANKFKDVQFRLKAADEARYELDSIKRKRLDIERQLANPDEWEAEQQNVLQNGTEADLDERIKRDQEVAADLDETIKVESAPIIERDAQLQAELDAADTDLQNALTGDERIAAQRKRDNVLARMSAWEGEAAEAKASLNESVKLRDQRINNATAAQEVRQTKTIADRKNAIGEIAKTPFLAPVAAKIQALDEEEANRIAGIANLPPEEQENAKAIVADDMTKKRAAVDQELKYAAQTMDANLRGLYEKYGRSTRSENWLTENDPQNEGLLFNLMQDAKKVGLTEPQVRQAMEYSAALDWSNPRKLEGQGRKEVFEDVRKLPDGKITVNPRYYLDEEEYKKVVEKADATPEAKANALAIRREVAAPLAARALSELMEDPQMGKWVQENTKGTPLERLEQFNAKLKEGGALGAAYNAFRSGSGSLASSLLGGYAAVTGNETATDAAQYYAQHAQAYGMAQEAAGKGTGTLGRFAGKVVGAAPSLIPAVAIGLASGGLGLGTSASLVTSSLASGVQSMGGTYLDAYEAFKDKGYSDSEARSKALAPAIASGLITSTLTQLGGARGVESIFKAATPETVKAGLKATLANIATNASEEALEEFSDQALQGLLASATYAPEKPITQALNEAIEAGLIGMALGGGVAAVKGTGGAAPATGETQTPPATPAPEVPAAEGETAAPTEVLPEVQASIENIIKNFAPDVNTLPQAIRATAKTRGVAKTSQDAARAIVAVAQGQDLNTLPSGLLESVGLARTAKGTIEAKDKKIAPLIEFEKGQAVIRDEAVEWLEQNGQDLLRAQIGKTETERRAEINTPKPAKAEVTPEPQPEPTPTSEPTPTPSPAQPEAAPTAEVAPKAKKTVKEAAPKKTTLLIGKGRAGPSVKAQFASEVDADAFSYEGANKNLTTGRNLSAADQTRFAKRAADVLAKVQKETGIPEAELRPILADYSKAVREQAKAAKPGESITASTLQEFIASKTLPPASQAQEEGSAGIVTQAGEGSISPVTESSVTPAENVSSPVIETKPQDDGKPSGKAAVALGVTKDGKIMRDGYVAASVADLSKDEHKRLVAASKALVDTLSKAEKIKGVRIVITDDPNVETAAANEDGDILINPRLTALNIAKAAKDINRTPKDLVIHELIHELAAQRLPRTYYTALWINLPEATKEASLNEYFRGVKPEDRGKISAHNAGAEFFAQIIEARLKGELASQVWDSPTLTEQVLTMLREYIAALRDLAGLITDPEIRGYVNNAADAVESDVRAALKEAGIEEDFLGAPPITQSFPLRPTISNQDAEEVIASRLYAPDAATPSPIGPESDIEAPSDAADQENVRQTLEDMEAYEDLRNDAAAMKALQKQVLAQGAGEMTPDPKNRALMGLTPETRAAQQAALVAQTINGIEIQRHADVFARAREAVATNRAAVEKQLFDKIEADALFDADDIAMAQQITERMQREITLNPDDAALYNRYLTLTNYWADNKTNVARSLAIMRDPQQTPLERMRQSIAVVGIPPLKVRMQIRAAWTPRQKAAEIAALEKQIANIENDAQVKLLDVESEKQQTIAKMKAELDAAIAAVEARPSKDEILASYIEENKRLQAEVLKSMNLSNDDVMLNPEDRYAVRQAMMESDGVKAAMAKFSPEQKAAVNLALNGYSDVEISKRTGFKPEEVAKVAENFRQNILKPAIAAEVKKGRTFALLLESGLNKIRQLLRAPAVDQFGNLVGTGEINTPNAAAIAAEIDRILDFTMQPARRRNRPNSLVAKVVQLPNGQKVRMFIPFDPDDARAFYRYAREMSTRDASAFDKVYEYWINGILSGPQTQVANIAGNALQIAWNYTAQRSAEALLNIAYRDPKGAKLGEFPHVFKAFYQSVVPAWDQAKLAWDTEADNTRTEYLNEPLTADFKDSNLDKVGGQRSSIQGTKGRIIRIPGRALRFFDSLFKTGVLHAEAAAIAYRQGRDLGLSGPALEAHMATRLAQKGNTVWQEAMTVADDLLFQSDNWATQIADDFVKRKSRVDSLEKAKAEAEAKGDSDAVNKIQKQMASAKFVASIMRFLFPFTRTPTNILRVGVRKAGGSAISGLFGVANGFYQMRNGKPWLDTVDAKGNKITGSYNKAAQVKDLSETFLAGMAWATLAGMAEGDDDDDKKMILIIGNRPYGAASAGEKAEVMRKYGGTQVVIFRNSAGDEIARFNYGRYEPFATAAGVIVDTLREIKQAGKTEGGVDAAKLAGSVGAHLIAQAESKSFLQGLAGIARTVEQVRAGQYEPGPALGKSVISGIVPNLIRQSMRNIDDYQRDFKSAGWLHEAFPTGDFAEPVIGPGGQPVKKGGNPLSRLLVQVPNAPSKKTAEATIQRYNLRNPGNRIERQPLTSAQLFAYGADGKTKIPVTDAKDKRAFTELYERIYEQKIRQGIAANPTINLPKPPLKAVSRLEEINSAALKETRERFLRTKLVQRSLNSAK